MKLTTTLNRIRACSPCVTGWRKLNAHLGKDFDPDAKIDLLTILESNGYFDAIWALRATVEDSREVAVLVGVKSAESVLPIYEKQYPRDLRPRHTIECAKRAYAAAAYAAAASDAAAAAYAAAAYAADAYAAYAAHAADAYAADAYEMVREALS